MDKITQEQMLHIMRLEQQAQHELGLPPLDFVTRIKTKFRVGSLMELTNYQYEQVLSDFEHFQY